MTTLRGDMWKSGADVILFTGNSTVRNDGCLVMGRGAALEATKKFRGCEKVFGDLITVYARKNEGQSNYGILMHPIYKKPLLGLFQVKTDWWEPARLDLIKQSTAELKRRAQAEWKDLQVSINFPGIGWGKLSRLVVFPIIKDLPDNVTVWEHSL